jgi:two-component system, cell cycle sensor histidine kinase and response regulator CckA
VEDESGILNLTKIILERQGYHVLSASTPNEAFRVAVEYEEEIHLLVTDVVMPEMNGRDLAETIASLYPGLKRVFMSGYTAEVMAHQGVLEKGTFFVQKPFSAKNILNAVRAALEVALAEI